MKFFILNVLEIDKNLLNLKLTRCSVCKLENLADIWKLYTMNLIKANITDA